MTKSIHALLRIKLGLRRSRKAEQNFFRRKRKTKTKTKLRLSPRSETLSRRSPHTHSAKLNET